MMERWNAMSLNIKNPETEVLIRRLATLKGVSLTYAVQFATQKEIERHEAELKNNEHRKGLAEWLMEIGRETAPLMNDGRSSKEVMDALYDDETGLPK
jgi:hypothetical protein